MNGLPPSLERLVEALGRFPGVGRKTATRFAFHLLKGAPQDAHDLADAVNDAVERVRRCEDCGAFCETSPCDVCRSPRRERHTLCIVEEATDIPAFEGAGFRGLYHVLGGLFSPLQGIVDPEQLRVDSLMRRLDAGEVTELIIATPPSPDGEATALWLAQAVEERNLNVTRLGMGLPMGGALEYADELTLQKSLESRRPLF